MRRRSLEKFSETNKRLDAEDKTPKRRRTSNDATIEYLTSKSDKEYDLRKRGLEIKQAEIQIMQQNQKMQQQQNIAMLELIKKFTKE